MISIHASREGSDPKGGEGHGSQVISIHASREGSDVALIIHSHILLKFQSTLPAREATKELANYLTQVAISIHASREGSDGP